MAFYKTRVSTCSDDEFKQIVLESKTYKEALNRLGYHHSGGAYITLKKRIKVLNISVDHMTPTARYGRSNEKVSNEKIFINGYKGGVKVRNRVLRDNLIPYMCAICGSGPEWNNKELTLTLDYINGDHYDNRIENLRFLCSNCDSQQDTYGAKNKVGYGSNFSPKSNTKCSSANCASIINKPSKVTKEDFILSLSTFKSFTEMGRRYNVSDNAIRKWCNKWGLPTSTNSMKLFVKNSLNEK